MSFDYGYLSRDELETRLAAAEAVCVMYAWSPVGPPSDRTDATYELWRRWTDEVPCDFTDRDVHRELWDSVEELAERRRAVQEATRARIAGASAEAAVNQEARTA